MPTFSIDDLTTPLTRQQVEATIYDLLGIVGSNVTSWKAGSPVRTVITAASIVMAALSQLTARVARSGFIELAEGPWLTLAARHVYNVERVEATFAVGAVHLVNSGGGVYLLDPGDLILQNPDTGATYRNVDAINLSSGATVDVTMLAVEAGSKSTSPAGTITKIVSPTMLSVSASNAAALVGLDEESDASVRLRCAEKLGALSPNGPWDAYSYAARNAKRADGTPIGVTRIRTVRDGTSGRVTTYVATGTGAVAAPDLALVDDAIQRKAAPLAVTATTLSATPITIAVSYRLWIYNTSGLSPAQIADAVNTKLIAFMTGQPIGGNVIAPYPGRVYVDALRAVIGSALPQIFHVEVTSPSADVELAVSSVPVLGTVTAEQINQVAPPEGAYS